MRLISYIAIAALAILSYSCAKQTAPTGGPKDEEAPGLIKSTPPDQQTNFKDNKIELVFDEMVQVTNAREQLIITPSIGTIGKDVEIIAKKNKVLLTINTKLKDSTTYTFNFRESIADLNEKNTKPLKLAISTGPIIDSIYIKGTVKNILTSELENNFTIAAIPQSDTFDIFKHHALFFTYSDKEGNYSLDNLKAGSYVLYSFNDKNKNLKVDSRSESYGFIESPIKLDSSLQNININTFKLDAGPLKLISSRPMFGIYNIKMSKSIVNYTLESSEKNQLVISQQDKDLSNIKVYNTLQGIDSLLVNFKATDSIENKIDTALYIKFNKESATKDKFQLSQEIKYIAEAKNLNAQLTFTKPVLKLNADSIYINIDSTSRVNFTEKDISWNNNQTVLIVNKKIENLFTQAAPKGGRNATPQENKKQKSYNKLVIGKEAIISIELDTLVSSETDIKQIKPENVGIISVKVISKEKFIVQLINKEQQIIREARNIEASKFENLEPGIYYLRLIKDENNNGKWDPGNFKKRIKPEEIKYYINSKDQKEINIKANWEVGPLLITL